MNKIVKVHSQNITDRQYWVELVYKISFLLLNDLSKGELKKLMPIEKNENVTGIEYFTHLETLERL